MSQRERLGAGILIALVAIVYFVRLGAAGLYDPNEGLYAEIPREMLVLGDWITPHYNFIRYFEKPPLLYWLCALAYKLFGVSPGVFRGVTVAAAVAGVGFTYGIGRSLWGRRAGLAAGIVLATSFGYSLFSRMVLPDMLFVSLLTAGFWGFVRGVVEEGPPRPGAVLCGYAGIAGAVLTKGLIGLVFPVLILGAYLLVAREPGRWARLLPGRGALLFLALVAPWHILVGLRNPGFFWFYFVNEHVNRFLGRHVPVDYATLPEWAYLLMIAIWMLPWTFFLPAALRYGLAREGGRRDRGFLFAGLWAAIIVGFFALSRSRLEYYCMPAFPALALCLGRLWDVALASCRQDRRVSRLVAAGWIGLLLGTAALIPAAYLFPRLENASLYNMFQGLDGTAPRLPAAAFQGARLFAAPSFASLVPLFQRVAAGLALGMAAAAGLWFCRRRTAALGAVILTMAGGILAVQKGLVLFDPHRSVARLASILRTDARPDEAVLVDGPYEQYASLDFYAGRRVLVYRGRFGDLQWGSRYPEAHSTFVNDEEFRRLWGGPDRVFLVSSEMDHLPDLAALSPETVVVARTGHNWLFANRSKSGDAMASLPRSTPKPDETAAELR